MTTADKTGEFAQRGPDRRDGEERRKTPRLSFDDVDRRQHQRRIAQDRRQG